VYQTQTLSLIEDAQHGNDRACEQIIIENTGLIWSVVRHFFGRGVDTEDLYQLGCMGLLKAVRGYDPQFGTQFSTYAVPKIAGEIRRFIRDDGPIKVSRGMKDAIARLTAVRAQLEWTLGREPKLSEIAEAAKMTPEEIACCDLASASVDSLQKEQNSDGFTIESVLGDDGIEEQLVEKAALKEAITNLPDREREIILLRYFKNLTQERVAKIMSVSQVQISRIEKKALILLREKMK